MTSTIRLFGVIALLTLLTLGALPERITDKSPDPIKNIFDNRVPLLAVIAGQLAIIGIKLSNQTATTKPSFVTDLSITGAALATFTAGAMSINNHIPSQNIMAVSCLITGTSIWADTLTKTIKRSAQWAAKRWETILGIAIVISIARPAHQIIENLNQKPIQATAVATIAITMGFLIPAAIKKSRSKMKNSLTAKETQTTTINNFKANHSQSNHPNSDKLARDPHTDPHTETKPENPCNLG